MTHYLLHFLGHCQCCYITWADNTNICRWRETHWLIQSIWNTALRASLVRLGGIVQSTAGNVLLDLAEIRAKPWNAPLACTEKTNRTLVWAYNKIQTIKATRKLSLQLVQLATAKTVRKGMLFFNGDTDVHQQ